MQLKNITVEDKHQLILRDVNVQCAKGSILAVVGEEDAGKTPLLSVIAGLKHYSRGMIEASDILSDHKHEGKKEMRFVPDDILAINNMTAGQWLDVIFSMYDVDEKEALDLLQQFSINEDEMLMDMTYGDNKCFSIIQAMITNPKLLILDEPNNFLNQDRAKQIWEKLLEKNRLGMTLIVSAEKYETLRPYSDSVVLLEQGQVVRQINVQRNQVLPKMIVVDGDVWTPLIRNGATRIGTVGRKSFFLWMKDGELLKKTIAKCSCRELLIEEVSLEEYLKKDYARWLEHNYYTGG